MNMDNKLTGGLIMGISIVIGAIVFMFNVGMSDIVSETCTHGPTCSMYDTISFQTYLSLAIAVLIFIIGAFIFLSKPMEKVIVKTKTRKIKEKKKPIDTKGLNEKEKKAIELLKKEEGMFQKTLMEELGIGKVGMTRLLDKLEAKQIIERKRRGMNNFVVLKSR